MVISQVLFKEITIFAQFAVRKTSNIPKMMIVLDVYFFIELRAPDNKRLQK